jgi:enediyne biosynthesis protein E7
MKSNNTTFGRDAESDPHLREAELRTGHSQAELGNEGTISRDSTEERVSLEQQEVPGRRAAGPRGTLIFGNLREFRRDPIGLIRSATAEFGDVVRLRFGPLVAHIVNHPAGVRQVLEERARNYDKRTRSAAKIRATCGDSLLSAEGSDWLRHRRLIQPALARQAVEHYAPTIAQATSETALRWSAAARAAQPVDLVAEMTRLTLSIAGKVLFGSTLAEGALVIERALPVVLQDTWRRIEAVFDPAALWAGFHRREFRRALAEIDRVVYSIIEGRRAAAAREPDLLAALLAARDETGGNGLSDLEVRDAALTMLLAGHETTANALAWTFALVASSPEVEQRLVDQPEGPSEGTDYAAQTFAEAIRLYPSIWIMERRAVARDTISGYEIPAGSTVLISPLVLQRHPGFWREPDRFDPERFSVAETASRPQHAYIPFGAGPHQCIGRFMAGLVARTILATLIRRFHLQPVEPALRDPVPGITLRHAGPLWMILSERT